MNRQVFVGSSKEGLNYAKEICDLLNNEQDIRCVLWPEIFEPGSLTFEALEEMLMECCAAVFVATPDDHAVIREKQVSMPRANVMLEFGLVAGRLGRHNIALCSYGAAELPSDLAGLTVIKMDGDSSCLPEAQQAILLQGGNAQLRRWCSRVLPTTERVPRTEIVHGYTGNWDFELQFETWRAIPVRVPSYAQVNGHFTLWISADGECGAGNAHGHLAFKLFSEHGSSCVESNPATDDSSRGQLSGHTREPRGSNQKPYAGEFQVAHEFQNVECQKDGGLKLLSRVHSIQPIHMSGRPWPQLEGLYGPPEPWLFEWALSCTPAPRVLDGRISTSAGGLTKGTVRAIKRHN